MFKPMPDLRPRPAVVTEQELAARCKRSLMVRETIKLENENRKLQAKAETTEKK